jgi:hypothetical protein
MLNLPQRTGEGQDAKLSAMLVNKQEWVTSQPPRGATSTQQWLGGVQSLRAGAG